MNYIAHHRNIDAWKNDVLRKLRDEYDSKVEETEIVYEAMDQLVRDGIYREPHDPDSIRTDLKMISHSLDKPSRYCALMDYYRESASATAARKENL